MAAKRGARKRVAVAERVPEYTPGSSPRRLLLDTHAWLWWYTGDRRLGRDATTLIRQSQDVRFSVASAWEIAIKRDIGKLVFRTELDLARELEQDGFQPLAIEIAHTEEVRQLPRLHRDPFDRMLIAQARIEGLTIVTADEHIARYDVSVFDARQGGRHEKS